MLRRQRLKQEIILELSALYDVEDRQQNLNDLRLHRFHVCVST